jgi:NAD-dependent deacetylase
MAPASPNRIKINRDSMILVLTGAGISAESGIRTFRDSDGLWEEHRVEDVATPRAFTQNPTMIWEFYKQRLNQAQQSEPNPGHYALVKLEKAFQGRCSIITQNVDGLHARAGSESLYEMHGSLYRCFCVACSGKYDIRQIDIEPPIPLCPACGSALRPDIVWFGEMPYFLEEIDKLLRECSVFLVVGTSGVVYPAAGFVMTAKFNGASTIAVNLDYPQNKGFIDEFHQGRSAEILPGLVDDWIRDLSI